eukprot:5198561-Pleurochrysis_carterae.AAC.1
MALGVGKRIQDRKHQIWLPQVCARRLCTSFSQSCNHPGTQFFNHATTHARDHISTQWLSADSAIRASQVHDPYSFRTPHDQVRRRRFRPAESFTASAVPLSIPFRRRQSAGAHACAHILTPDGSHGTSLTTRISLFQFCHAVSCVISLTPSFALLPWLSSP